MSAASFNDAITRVLRAEGGYVNDPADPGGETKYGISKRSYPDVDITALTLEQAQAIYKRDYWDVCRCDDLPAPLDALVFDAAVNQGTHTAVVMMQRCVGVNPDGIIGPVTISTAQRVGQGAAADYLTERALRYMVTANADRYLKGWIERLFTLALAL